MQAQLTPVRWLQTFKKLAVIGSSDHTAANMLSASRQQENENE